MQIISKSRLKEFWTIYPDAEFSLRTWYKIAVKARWKSLGEIRNTYNRSVDAVKNFTIFNIGGNKYRLITFMDYESGKIFIRHILTHEEYDRETWKQDLWYNI